MEKDFFVEFHDFDIVANEFKCLRKLTTTL